MLKAGDLPTASQWVIPSAGILLLIPTCRYKPYFTSSCVNSGDTEDGARVGCKQFNGEIMAESRAEMKQDKGDAMAAGSKGLNMARYRMTLQGTLRIRQGPGFWAAT